MIDHFFSNNDIDLLPIYDMGRLIIQKPKDKISDLYPINEEIYKSIKEILKICNTYNFNIGFLELSIFDPKDSKAEEFFTVLASSSDTIIEEYSKTMGCNIEHDITILPNSIFYNAPFYFQRKKTEKFFSPLYISSAKNHFMGKITGFNTKADAVDKKYKKATSKEKKIVSNIQEFFNRVEANCFNEKQGKELNSFLIVPLFRPAAPIDNAKDHIFRGGALMLFGHTEENFNKENFALVIQNLLLKQIFKASHTEIEVQMKQMAIELSLYHHFGNNLEKLILPLMEDSFQYDNLKTQQILKLDYVKNTFLSLISSTKAVLETYNSYVRGKPSYFSLKEIASKIEDIISTYTDTSKELNRNNFKVKISEDVTDEKISLNPNVFVYIASHFIVNSIEIFNDMEYKIGERMIFLKIYKEKSNIIFIFGNNGPPISERKLNMIGKIPISDSNSTGLGYYFLDFCLNLSGALKHEELFFEPKNSKNQSGFEISFSFKILENEKSNLIK